MRHKYKLPPIFALWLLIVLTLALFVWVSFSDDMNIGNYTIKKGKFPETLLTQEKPDVIPDILPDTLIVPIVNKIVNGPDSTIRNVLVFGDSMTHYLAMSIAKYGSRNNYTVTSVTWVSSSITKWSKTDKLKKYMEMVEPDFVIISLGANDVNLKNFNSKIPEIQGIISQLDSVPYIWVGPPLWKKDKGLYDILEKTLAKGQVFHLDENFKIQRAADHIHPTHKGADAWADTLMRWIKTSNLPLLAELPDTVKRPLEHNFIYLHAKD